jgi:acyl-CoA synthetase (AMP-forming)/AMP-acid ligase II
VDHNLPDFRRSFLDILDEAFTQHADRICIRFHDDTYTYAEVDKATARIANALLANGFTPGMKGAVYALNSAVGFIATLGIIRAGGTWIPVNPRNSAEDNVKVMLQFECHALFYQQSFEAPIMEVRKQSSEDTIVVNLDRGSGHAPYLNDWMEGHSDAAPAVEVQPDDLVSIPLTGGTTGIPKGVMLSHSNFCAFDFGMRLTMGTDGDRVWLCAAPMTHVGGRVAISCLSSGCKFVILDQVDIQEIMTIIEREKITDMFLPPTAIYTWLEQPNIGDFDYSSLRRVGYGSAPMSLEKLRQAIKVIGPVMQNGFGQTECPLFIATFPPEEHLIDGDIAPDSRLASVGRATAISELAIFDDDGKELAPRELGEIGVCGPCVSLGYYRAPEETAKIRRDGWHLTGDIGYLDEEGYLFIVDRKKDMIISGGFNVYSTEVEQALMAIPGVRVASVIGVPSEKWGEEVKALVQLESGCDLDAEQIMAIAKERLGSVKAPKSVEIVDDFPRTAVGKIDKKVIRAAYWEGQAKKI